MNGENVGDLVMALIGFVIGVVFANVGPWIGDLIMRFAAGGCP